MSNPIPSTYQERDRVRDQRNATGIGQAAEAPLASQAARDVLAERERQKAVEGWTEAHDDGHANESLAQAAACYAMPDPALRQVGAGRGMKFVPMQWPSSWSSTWWKPKDRRRDLVRAGALILAEIERLDRAAIAATDKA